LGPFGDFPSATNNIRPALGGAAAAARRQHGLEVKDEGHLKDFDVIFVFVELLCTVRYLFKCQSYIRKKVQNMLI
jgi:hypothetical protein